MGELLRKNLLSFCSFIAGLQAKLKTFGVFHPLPNLSGTILGTCKRLALEVCNLGVDIHKLYFSLLVLKFLFCKKLIS